MKVIRETEDYAVLEKSAGEDSEKDMPAGLLCVHRLDRAAAGLLVYAKNRRAAAELSRQLQEGLLQKSYYAVAVGSPGERSGSFTDLLYHDKRKQKMFPVKKPRSGVKRAELRYELLAEAEKEDGELLSLLRIQLRTGRFHQIRVQLASRRMPLVGDGKYGSRIKAPALALFCGELGFQEPGTGEGRCFAALPEETFPWLLFSREAFSGAAFQGKERKEQ